MKNEFDLAEPSSAAAEDLLSRVEAAVLKDGVHEGLDARTYHRIDAVGNSGTLKKFARSPRYFRLTRGQWREPTPDTRIGSAAHCLLLQPDLYEKHFVEPGRCVAVKAKGGACANPGKYVRGGLARCGQHDDESAGPLDPREVLDPDGAKRAREIAAAVLEDDDAASVLRTAPLREVTILWTDKETGLRCKGRVDILGLDGAVRVWEFKKSLHAAPEEFDAEIRRRDYHRQLAWYGEGLAALGRLPEEYGIIAAQDSAADDVHEVGVYDLSLDAVMLGREVNRSLLRRYAECARADEWPGWGRRPISVPAWALGRDEENGEGATEGALQVDG